MATIRPATTADLEGVASYVANAFAGDPARYRRYLEYSWLADKPDLGVLVEEGGKIRGFIGAIYADRPRGGEPHRFCNLTSIAVDESHRKLTLQLFNALLRRPGLTFTCFSASDRIAKILDFFKFSRRPSDKVIVGPVSNLGALRDARHVCVVSDPVVLAAELPEVERRIAHDHAPYRCGQLLITKRDRRCFVVTARRGRGLRAFADVLYASNPGTLMDCLPWIHGPLFRAHGTLLTGIDRRWISTPPRASFVYAKLRPVYMRSKTLGIHEIDALYSELVPSTGTRALTSDECAPSVCCWSSRAVVAARRR